MSKRVLLIMATNACFLLIVLANNEYPKCRKNELLTPRSFCCEPTCSEDCSYNIAKKICSEKPACVCKHGFVRHKSKCIRKSRCPKLNDTNSTQTSTTVQYITLDNEPKPKRHVPCGSCRSSKSRNSTYIPVPTAPTRCTFEYNTKRSYPVNPSPEPPVVEPKPPTTIVDPPPRSNSYLVEPYYNRRISTESKNAPSHGCGCSYGKPIEPVPPSLCNLKTSPPTHTTTTQPYPLKPICRRCSRPTPATRPPTTAKRCPSKCDLHQKLSICRPCCVPTCDNDCSKAKCSKICIAELTCICVAGYVMHEGRCIPKDQCPRPPWYSDLSDENDEYSPRTGFTPFAHSSDESDQASSSIEDLSVVGHGFDSEYDDDCEQLKK
ncbi:zonadhesin-like [Topomyia yanbarensis]|uniref:zonadhesin-like n=1 Tax=Topomyia yanbarensis TaxID=2498891 RepID=UPI00273BC39B|nr:zonadhesin-like [Topomyia yanbarensis]